MILRLSKNCLRVEIFQKPGLATISFACGTTPRRHIRSKATSFTTIQSRHEQAWDHFRRLRQRPTCTLTGTCYPPKTKSRFPADLSKLDLRRTQVTSSACLKAPKHT